MVQKLSINFLRVYMNRFDVYIRLDLPGKFVLV